MLDKEKKLREKIEKAQEELKKLETKRKLEIGTLAVNAKLGHIDNKTLKAAFERLAMEVQHDDSTTD